MNIKNLVSFSLFFLVHASLVNASQSGEARLYGRRLPDYVEAECRPAAIKQLEATAYINEMELDEDTVVLIALDDQGETKHVWFSANAKTNDGAIVTLRAHTRKDQSSPSEPCY